MQIQSFNCHKHGLYNAPKFCGAKVALIDAGAHGEDIRHFARAVLPNDTEIKQIYVNLNKKVPAFKQISSLLSVLKEINLKPKADKPDYLAMPILIPIQLNNLSTQMNKTNSSKISLNAKNIKENKQNILDFLKKLSLNPEKYQDQLKNMDFLGLEMEYTYPLIQEINKAVKSGVKVYVPSGHPEYQALRYVIKENNSNPELFKYLSSGMDVKSTIRKAVEEVRRVGGYEFNFLSLSDAQVVNLRDAQNQHHIFSSHDNLETISARGIYNLYPVRENGKVLGFSYTDKTSIHYPITEMPYRDKLEPLYKFVGLQAEEVLASDKLHKKFKRYLKNPFAATKKDKELFNQKLFEANKLFDIHTMYRQKMKLKGRYVNADLNMHFDKNKQGEIIFPNCNYERSDRPSVKSMAGACFSLCNAIAQGIIRSIG